MRNKAQTAMEYLMTYGWAILIIIVVIAALYSLGVFSVKPSVSCSPCFSYFAFRDYAGGATDVLYLRNGPRSVEVACVSGCTVIAGECGGAGDPCDPGEDIDLTVNAAGGSIDVEIQYTDVDTTVIRTDTAKIHE
jgi:hypothetical protein